MPEEWRQVVGYEGYYEVSSLGRVRSLDRYCYYVNGRVDFIRGQLKSQRPRKDGYMQVNLCRESKKSVALVHHMVFEAFYGPRDRSLDVCHGDGVRSNNTVHNLRQDTRKGNFEDMIAHGTRSRGERHGAAKLTDEQAERVRQDPRNHSVIGAEYGIHKNHVSRIKRGVRRAYHN